MGRYPKPDKDRHKLFTCSLPGPQFEQVNKASKAAGIPRSRFIQHAIAYFLAKNTRDDDGLNKYTYRDYQEQSKHAPPHPGWAE